MSDKLITLDATITLISSTASLIRFIFADQKLNSYSISVVVFTEDISITMDRSQRSAQPSAGSRASAENRGHSSGHQDKDEQTRPAARYNRVRVQDLLNDEHSSRSHSSLSKESGEAVCLVEGCGKKFFTQKSLVVHQKRSHAAPTDFICHLCRCSFSSIPNLNKHVSHFSSLVAPGSYDLLARKP